MPSSSRLSLSDKKSPALSSDLKNGSSPSRERPLLSMDWSAGIVDRMGAYTDWWNLPVRRKPSAGKA